ncbi:MAG: PIN domain-containing protein [Actinomycetota bacterium]|nr:PIN domain-containing protein [Actinomycetota bacterium]
MTFLDAYALVALMADEPAAEEVEAILRKGETRVVIVNLAEAMDISQRVSGLPNEEVRTALEPLLLSDTLAVAVSDEPEAWLAAELRSKHYDRKTCALSMADCFLLAHGLTEDRSIATADPPLAAVARKEGLEVVALPDTAGSRP